MAGEDFDISRQQSYSATSESQFFDKEIVATKPTPARDRVSLVQEEDEDKENALRAHALSVRSSLR